MPITWGVIRLHRLSARAEVFYLNPDLIVSIDSTPDTVMTLTTHQKVLVKDAPEDVVAAIEAWRAGIIARALPQTPRRRSDAPLSLVRSTAGSPPPTHEYQEDEDR
jgi:flagellar protein FlbD